MEQLLVHSGSWVSVAVTTVVRGAGILFVSSHFFVLAHRIGILLTEILRRRPLPLSTPSISFSGKNDLPDWGDSEEKFLLILTPSLKPTSVKPCIFSFSASTFLLENTPGLRSSPKALFLSPTCTMELLRSFQVCTSAWYVQGDRCCSGFRDFKSSQ